LVDGVGTLETLKRKAPLAMMRVALSV